MLSTVCKESLNNISIIIVPTNTRAGKRPHLTTSKQGMSGCRQPKRRLQISELVDGGEYLSDIDESLSESSDEDVVVTNNGLPVKHAVTSKVPMPPSGGKLSKPLIFKHSLKVRLTRQFQLFIVS